jgi:hypothetical protein
MLAQVSMVVFTMGLFLTEHDTGCLARRTAHRKIRFSDLKTQEVTCRAGRTRERHEISFMSRGNEASPYICALPHMPIPNTIKKDL